MYKITKIMALMAIYGLIWACYTVYGVSDIVLQTICGEARGESLIGQAWVAKVIQNRAKKGLSYEEVCKKPKQFSYWNNREESQTFTQEELEKAERAWDMAFHIESDVDHYHADYCNPSWRSKALYEKRIGNHVFMKVR